MSDERTKILQKIANLRARASDDASSEAEVMAAAARAEKLMEAYRVTEADLALAESEGRVTVEIIRKYVDGSNGNIRHKAQLCWNAINTLCGTKGVRYTSDNRIEFMGDAPDVEYAVYLFDLIKVGLDRAYAAYRRETGGQVGRNAKANFQVAMASAVSSRLYLMAREAEAERAAAKAKVRPAVSIADMSVSDQRALVVVDAFEERKVETERAYRKAHPRVRSGPGWSMGGRGNGNASSAGRAAGTRLGLGRGVGSHSQARISA